MACLRTPLGQMPSHGLIWIAMATIILGTGLNKLVKTNERDMHFLMRYNLAFHVDMCCVYKLESRSRALIFLANLASFAKYFFHKCSFESK